MHTHLYIFDVNKITLLYTSEIVREANLSSKFQVFFLYFFPEYKGNGVL